MQHRAVFLHAAFQNGAGEQLHLLGIALLVLQDAAHGIVEEILALFLGQKVVELIGQVIGKLLLGHGGDRHRAGEDLGRGQQQRAGRERDAVRLRAVAQKIRHGVHRQDAPAGDQSLGRFDRDRLFQLPAGEADQPDAVLRNFDANDLFHVLSSLSFIKDSGTS